MDTVMLCKGCRISSENISLGIVHPIGPHDHPKAKTKRHIRIITVMDKGLGSSWWSPNFKSQDYGHCDLFGMQEKKKDIIKFCVFER